MWQFRRCVSTRSLVYSKYGNPRKVLQLTSLPCEQPSKNEVAVRMHVAPINPSDLNQVQGVYPIKPTLPAVGGNEGAGEVVEVGSNVTSFAVGDRVVLGKIGLGTWTTRMIVPPEALIKIPDGVTTQEAALLTVNPATAYVLLTFQPTHLPNPVIIQNAANSAVGTSIIQMAKIQGIPTINIIRNRYTEEESRQARERLRSIGADYVFTEEDIEKHKLSDLLPNFPKPTMAFNAVGGRSATNLARNLRNHGTILTYGGMSRHPVCIPTASLIFNNISIAGFWMSRWKEDAPEGEWEKLLSKLMSFVADGKLKLFYESVPFENWQDALKLESEDFKDRKIVFDMTQTES